MSMTKSADDFSKEVAGVVAQGFVAVGLSMGIRLGMFEGLAKLAQSQDTAVTSQQLADSLNFKERYVREWINGMVCGGIIDHITVSGTDRYWLESYRLETLLGGKLAWVASLAECIPPAAADSRGLIEACFPIEGPKGTNVDDHPWLHEYLAQRNVLWKYPENVRLILEDDQLISKLEQGIDVLEIGCGAAGATKAIATQFPNSRFVASDLSELNVASAKASCEGLSNVTCAVVDACKIPEEMKGKFDLVMLFDVYHDLPQPQALVDGALELLNEGGQFFMNDVDQHEAVSDNKARYGAIAAFHYIISSIYCVPTSLGQSGGEALGACAGVELFERRLNKDFAEVKRVARKVGLYFLCTK